MSTTPVNTDALRQVLQALCGPGHYILELQATRSIASLTGSPSPIDVLIEDYKQSLAPVQAEPPITYTPGEWFDATTVDLMQAFFESRLPAIREAAKEHGYAIGLHGSMRRDLDLIAAPWREGAAEPDTLAHAIAMAACGITRAGAYEWEKKPAGRVATCLPICWTHRHGVLSDGHIDLSVMPAQGATTNPLRDTLVRLVRETGMTRGTRDDELARLRHIETAAAIATTALWQMDNHPACAALRGEQAAKP